MIVESKSSRCRILRKLGSVKKKKIQSPLKKAHIEKRFAWAEANLKTNFSKVIFSDECRVSLDGPDGWDSGWVVHQQEAQTRIHRQQGGGGVMIWCGIIDDKLIGPVQVQEGVKIDSKAYCNILEQGLLPWLDQQSEEDKESVIFQQDNATSHTSLYTRTWLEQKGISGEKLMTWPPNSPDLNCIENFWSILKREVYSEGRQFSSKNELWEAIKVAATKIKAETIKKLTSSMDKRLIELIQKKGKKINY